MSSRIKLQSLLEQILVLCKRNLQTAPLFTWNHTRDALNVLTVDIHLEADD